MSLTLPAGSAAYLFGYATGGARPSTGFAAGQVASVTDADGYVAAALAETFSDSDSFSTSAAFYSMAGVGVSGFSSLSAVSTGSNAGPGSTLAASVTFPVTTANSLVVIIALASSQQALSLSGVSGLHTDASTANPPNGPVAVAVAHVCLGPGDYTVTQTSVETAAGQDPNHATNLIGAFVFSP